MFMNAAFGGRVHEHGRLMFMNAQAYRHKRLPANSPYTWSVYRFDWHMAERGYSAEELQTNKNNVSWPPKNAFF